MSLSSFHEVSAARRQACALNYRSLAEMLLEQEAGSDAAGALLYEAAKQCINAVANKQGVNPGPTGAKFHFLAGLAREEVSRENLMENWQSAVYLHINADRLNLTGAAFEVAWRKSLTFIEQMLQIYSGD